MSARANYVYDMVHSLCAQKKDWPNMDIESIRLGFFSAASQDLLGASMDSQQASTNLFAITYPTTHIPLYSFTLSSSTDLCCCTTITKEFAFYKSLYGAPKPCGKMGLGHNTRRLIRSSCSRKHNLLEFTFAH